MVRDLPSAEPRLVDAAHIVMDADEQLGQPVISNGLPLTKTLGAQHSSVAQIVVTLLALGMGFERQRKHGLTPLL